ARKTFDDEPPDLPQRTVLLKNAHEDHGGADDENCIQVAKGTFYQMPQGHSLARHQSPDNACNDHADAYRPTQQKGADGEGDQHGSQYGQLGTHCTTLLEGATPVPDVRGTPRRAGLEAPGTT